ncbi:cyclodeaminase [Paludifilum halophilum]|uniref:Cyclodeaminase n=1 Tax=Paludifilum halophilum TaxID=1642702 RepID=A0A235BB79_9BACL|nr:cyclodeaminase [Paludifilum halophilum]OYD08825.1 cyclodeaminase [Paludifilum halophilum]
MWIFREEEIRRQVKVDESTIAAVEEGFAFLAQGAVRMPDILRIDIPEHDGEVDVKTAVVSHLDSFAVKISSGFFRNPQRGLPSGNGMMVLIRTDTGVPEAVFLDNGYLTDLRTAAAGAVAAKYLCGEEVKTAGVIGAGTQAQYQVRALARVRSFDKLRVYSPTVTRRNAFCKEMGEELGVQAIPARDPEEVVRSCQVLITATPAKQPVVRREWLHPGLHITAMGSDAEQKQELDPDVLKAADRLVCDSKAQSRRLGELRSLIGSEREPDDVSELGELVADGRPGRRGREEITVCDLTGTGVQDTVIAIRALHALREQGCGFRF